MKEDKKKSGQPTKYKAEYDDEAYQLCLLGYTDKQLAAHFEVSVDTIAEWKKTHASFAERVRLAKDLADSEVATALFKRAKGFEYDEVTYEKLATVVDGVSDEPDDIKLEQYRKKIVTKMVVPDTGAAMNWLANRQKSLWRNKVDVNATNTNTNYNSVPLTKDEIRNIEKELQDEY